MPCDECRELTTHEFRSPADLVHAVQVAAAEMDRGVLRRLGAAGDRSLAEEEALQSAFAAGRRPDKLSYRFECTTCGDRFELAADTAGGTGRWTRTD